MDTCTIDGCSNPPYRNGICNMHRLRIRRYGSPDIVKKVYKYATQEERSAAEARWRKTDYENHKDAYIARAARWQSENPAHYTETKRAYLERPETKAAAINRTKEWRKTNPDAFRAHSAAARAAKRNAIPGWLTEEDNIRIREIYAEAIRITSETGIPHHVDHIIPLRGKNVSGLHVPANLEVVSAEYNLRKKNKWDG